MVEYKLSEEQFHYFWKKYNYGSLLFVHWLKNNYKVTKYNVNAGENTFSLFFDNENDLLMFLLKL